MRLFKRRAIKENTLNKNAKELARYIDENPDELRELSDRLATLLKKEAGDDVRLALMGISLFISSNPTIEKAWESLHDEDKSIKEKASYIG